MRVIVACDGSVGDRLAERLRREDVDVRLVVAASAPAAAAADAMTGRAAAELLGELAGSDALAVAATREALTAQLATACDRFGVRIVAVCADAAERRLAEMFGVVAADPDEAAAAVVRPAPAPEAPPARGRVLTVWGLRPAPTP